MNTGVISVGTKAELEFTNSFGSRIGTYTGEFIKVLSDREVILFSSGQGRLPSMTFSVIHAGVSFHHPLHGLLGFEGVLTCKEETRDGTKFTIKIDESKEIQRREYFRPDCHLKAEFRFVKDSAENQRGSADEIPYKAAKTKNISFKGVCILLDEADPVFEKERMDLIVWLNNDLDIKMRCRVIRIVKHEKDTYELGLTIEEINESDQELLSKYITECAIIGKS